MNNIPEEVEEWLSSLTGEQADAMAVWAFKNAINNGDFVSPRALAGFVLAEYSEDELDRLDRQSAN